MLAHRFGGTFREKTVVQKLPPIILTLAAEAAESFPHNVVRIGFIQTADARENFEFGQSVEQRFDKRLDGDQRAVGGAGVTP